MNVQVLLVSLVLTCASADLSPIFTELGDNTLQVVFPASNKGVELVRFTYNQNSGHHLVPVHKVLGSYTYKLKKEGDEPLHYRVQYLSSQGDVLLQTEGTYQWQGSRAVVPKHHVVRRGSTVLEDNFNSNHLDMSKWVYDITAWGGGNNEFQIYSPEGQNTYIRNGILYLRPTFTADKFGDNFLHSGTLDVRKTWGQCTSDNEGGCYRRGKDIPPIMSSKIHSKATISHGRVEVVAKLPVGDWLWPAIWLLPEGWPWKYGGWPASGEIDIMEARGNRNLKDYQGNDQGINVIYSTIHWGPDFNNHRQAGHWRKTSSGTWADGYHTYSVDWTADHIRMDVDGQPAFAWNTPSQGYYSYSHFNGNNPWSHGGHDAPFDGKMGLILNVAVGGNFFNDNWINAGHAKPWHQGSSSQMTDFWNKRHDWQSTWHGDDVAMKIKSVKMIQY